MSTATAESLLGPNHVDSEVEKVLETLARDDMAYYDPKKNKRKVPVFAYDPDGAPVRITHWAERDCAPDGMTREEAEMRGLDWYHSDRGWVRRGKKAERDFRY